MNDTDALLIMNHLRVGPITARRLMDRFGSPSSIFSASPRDIERASFISSDNANRIKNWEKEVNLEKALHIIKEENIRLLTYTDPDYPPLLKEIYDHPLLLYLKGTLSPRDGQSIGIVGTRSASGYGRAVARKWSSQLAARGFTIVSGLARGIDTQAHWGTLEANGRTIAVLGYGFGYIYPKENARLYHEIEKTGAIVTEYPWKKYHGKTSFPLRNRLIAGLSRATLVVESRQRGGSLITAHFANEYNRSVFSVPGPVNSATSRGTNRLIRDGATLVTSVDEITEEFEFLFPQELFTQKEVDSKKKYIPKLDANEETLYAILTEPYTLDQLSQKSDLSIEKVTTAMLTLELKGLVRALPGKMYDRK
jgi:DNA processing protein